MKLFISWADSQAEAIAEFLREQLATVLAGAVEPFFSSRDIAKGERGINVISEQLEEMNYGVVVLTRASVRSEWVNFEAGALAKSVGEGRVSTLRVGLSRADVKGPLAQFQDTDASSKEDMKRLIRDISEASGGSTPIQSLDVLFEAFWPGFEAAVSSSDADPKPRTERGDRDILEEVLDIVRSLQREAVRESPEWSEIAGAGELLKSVRLRNAQKRARETRHDPQVTGVRALTEDEAKRLNELLEASRMVTGLTAGQLEHLLSSAHEVGLDGATEQSEVDEGF